MKILFVPVIISCLGFAGHFSQISFEDSTAAFIPAEELKNNSMDVETADLDKDGDMDMVIAMEFRPNILLLNDGTGKLINASAGRLPQANFDSEDIALADFDKDGDIDIIFVAEDDRNHEYCINDGKANFSNANDRFRFRTIANAVDAADYDKDGDADLILGNQGQELFLANDGKGNFADETKDRLPNDNSTTQDVQSADIDKDGDLDLVIGNEDGNRLYLNDGKGFFADATEERLPPANEETRKVDLADVDSDGDLDIFFSNVDFGKQKDKSNRILINNGKGSFVDETRVRFLGDNNMHTGDAAFFDFDNDGDLDLALANLFGGYTQMLTNVGKGIFKETTDETFGSKIRSEAISVEVIDLNKDKKMDLYYGMFRAPDKFYLNTSR